jgi:hypothetical protein
VKVISGPSAYSLACILGEVVGSDKAPSHTLIETGPSVVGSVEDGVLEATGVLEVQVELAVLAAVGRDGAGADVGLELIEAISDDLGLCEWMALTVNAECFLGRKMYQGLGMKTGGMVN